MSSLSFATVANILDANYLGDNVNFASISTDTRTIMPGELFIALQGENFNGNDYIQEAIVKGASGVITSNVEIARQLTIPCIAVEDSLAAYSKLAAHHRNKFNIPIIAITGSCGKTTVKEMIYAILSKAGNTLKNYANFNNEIGVPKTLLQLNSEHDFAVIEMGARQEGDIAHLTKIVNPTISIVTNIGLSHLEIFGSQDKIAAAKSEIYTHAKEEGTAIVNADDQYAPFMLTKSKQQNICTFGLDNPAEVTCAYMLPGEKNILFELVCDIGSIPITLPTIGEHNVANALAAVAAARSLGILLPEIKSGLESFVNSPNRLQLLKGTNGATVIDDTYNASPSSMMEAISVLTKYVGKKILVIGDMLELGEQSLELHQQIGSIAKHAKIDKLYTIGKFAKSAVTSFGQGAKCFNSKHELIQALELELDKSTTVLLKASNAVGLSEVASSLSCADTV